MSIIKHVTLQKIVAHDFRYDLRTLHEVTCTFVVTRTLHEDTCTFVITRTLHEDICAFMITGTLMRTHVHL